MNVATTLLTVASDCNVFVCGWWIYLGSFKGKCAGAFHLLPDVMIYRAVTILRHGGGAVVKFTGTALLIVI